jgi:hypothetical protein
MCVLAPGLSLSIMLTLLSMCGTNITSTCSRPAGANPYDPRGRLHANNTKSIVPTHIFHVHILRFHWDFFIFYFMRRQQIENKK